MAGKGRFSCGRGSSNVKKLPGSTVRTTLLHLHRWRDEGRARRGLVVERHRVSRHPESAHSRAVRGYAMIAVATADRDRAEAAIGDEPSICNFPPWPGWQSVG